jgi:hypothetical protein
MQGVTQTPLARVESVGEVPGYAWIRGAPPGESLCGGVAIEQILPFDRETAAIF